MEEHKSLLTSRQDEEDDDSTTSFSPTNHGFFDSPRYRKTQLVYVFLLHVALGLCLLTMLLNYVSEKHKDNQKVYSKKRKKHPLISVSLTNAAAPLLRSIDYVVKTERSNGSLKHNAYTGYPTDGNTRAWEELIERLYPRPRTQTLACTS